MPFGLLTRSFDFDVDFGDELFTIGGPTFELFGLGPLIGALRRD